MPLIIPSNSISDGGYAVANSCRFNSGSSDSLTRTLGTPTNNKKWTYSFWVKQSAIGDGNQTLLSTGSDTSYIYFRPSDAEPVPFGFSIESYVGGFQYRIIPNMVFRDPSAWRHIVIAFDTTQGTDTNRVKVYNNGTQITSFNIASYPSQNLDTQVNSAISHKIGGFASGANLNAYLSEVCFIDGQQLDATSFGEFDEDSGIWKPIDVSGLTFGINGFYLPFENSGALGQDDSGNENNFTVNNLTAIDQTTDTPTNNFCTLNSLDSFYADSTFSEGNLKIVTEASLSSYNTSTIGLTQGKWYCEVFIETTPHPTTKDSMIGIAGRMSESHGGFSGFYNDTYGIYGGNGNIYNNNSASSYGVSHTTNDIIGIYMDLDNNKLYFAKNGILMNSGTGKDIISASSTKAGAYFMVADDFGNGYQGTYRLNFGNPIYSLTSGNTDVNGYGNFEYDPSAGTFDSASKDFLAICTANLSEVLG